ncbi:hypothetical protein K3495_g11295 [Podosphaera aphanis]|nr:hypothetical protein K3495_g11295 [Podosphaera aphanis]
MESHRFGMPNLASGEHQLNIMEAYGFSVTIATVANTSSHIEQFKYSLAIHLAHNGISRNTPQRASSKILEGKHVNMR